MFKLSPAGRWLYLIGFLVIWIAEVRPAAAQPPAADRDRYWTTRWNFEDIDVQRLAARLRSIGIDVGIRLSGSVTVRLEVGVPLTSLTDAAAYRLDGVLSSSQLTVNDLRLRDLTAVVEYRDGVAEFKQLAATVIDAAAGAQVNDASQRRGTVRGQALLQLVPRRDASADITVRDLPLGPITTLIDQWNGSTASRLPSGGVVDGEVQLTVPIDEIDQLQSYELMGDIRVDGLQLLDLPAVDVRAPEVAIDQGRLRIQRFSLASRDQSASIRLAGNVDVPLDGSGSFSASIVADDLPTSRIADLIGLRTSATPIVRGKLDAKFLAAGELNADWADSTWEVTGSVASPSIAIAGVDLGMLEHDLRFTPTTIELLPRSNTERLPAEVRLESIRSNYSIRSEVFTLESLQATLMDGTISGSGTLPRQPGRDFALNLTIDGVRPVVEVAFAPRGSAAVAATLTGNIDWRVPLAAWNDPDEHRGVISIVAGDITVGEEAVGSLQAELAADRGQIRLDAYGDLLGGSVSVDTIGVLEADDAWSDLPARLIPTRFVFESVSINRATRTVLGDDIELSGAASGEAVVDWKAWRANRDVFPEATLSMRLSQVRYRNRFLSREIRIDAALQRDVVSLQRFVGDYAGGTVRLNGRVVLIDSQLAFHPRADLQLTATRIDVQRGMCFIGDPADELEGRMSLSATVSGYQEAIRVRGNLDGRELSAYGILIGLAHSSLLANLSLDSLRWEVRLPAIRSSVGGGQLEGELRMASGGRGGVDLVSRWRTRRVDFVRLSDQLGRSTTWAEGDITGELTLQGKSVRSVDDLSGRFNFALGDTRGAAIPGLLAASRFLGPVSLVQQSFDTGNLRGIIGQGVVVIDELWLGSDTALIRADGKAYLRSGRLDLEMLIATGDYRDIAGDFAALASRYALRSLIPASAIFSVSDLLRNRTLVIAVMGTVDDPVVRLRPVETFREEAVRFLLREGQRLILAGITAEAVTADQ